MPEVLIAMAIFAIGFTAVASIFPVAILLQKATTEDVLVQIATDNARALLQSRKLNHNSSSVPTLRLDEQIPEDILVHFLPFSGVTGKKLAEVWTRGDRSYPKAVTALDDRDVYWEMLVRRTIKKPETTANDWQVFVFVMVQEAGTQYFWPDVVEAFEWAAAAIPGDLWSITFDGSNRWRSHPNVVRVDVDGVSGSRFSFNNRRWPAETLEGEPDQVRAGDLILDSNGTIYQVVDADATGVEVDGFILSSPAPPDAIWYGVPAEAGKANPVRRILVISDAVE